MDRIREALGRGANGRHTRRRAQAPLREPAAEEQPEYSAPDDDSAPDPVRQGSAPRQDRVPDREPEPAPVPAPEPAPPDGKVPRPGTEPRHPLPPEGALHTPVLPFDQLDTDAPVIGHVATTPLIPRLSGRPTALAGIRADAGLLAGRWIAAASLTGAAHLNNGTTGQDAYSFAPTGDGEGIVLIACDGLGSRPLTAQLGAELYARRVCAAASTLTADAVRRDPEAALADAVREANDHVRGIREKLMPELSDRDLACTVLLCWVPLPPSDQVAHVIRVGDGNVFSLASGDFDCAFPNETGPVNVVGAFLPQPDPRRLCEFARVDLTGREQLIVATDGLAFDLFDSRRVREWLARQWRRPCDATRMINALRYRRQGSPDDRTGVVLWLKQPEGCAQSEYARGDAAFTTEGTGDGRQG